MKIRYDVDGIWCKLDYVVNELTDIAIDSTDPETMHKLNEFLKKLKSHR